MSIKNFDSIKVSTHTIIGTSNVEVPIETIFEKVPITHYTVIPKKRGRKKKEVVKDPNTHLKDGDIITLKYRELLRGTDLKAKKKKKTNAKYFRNALTIVMYLDNKLINFKISNNGKFQITGCKKMDHALRCVQYFSNYIIPNLKEKNMSVVFQTVMTNIDFNLGFLVNRENLDKYINYFTNYNSLLETSFGYTGVNIKFPMTQDIDIDLPRITWNNGKWYQDTIPYKKFVDGLPLDAQHKINNKKRYNTFLVFHSGNVIMSGMTKKYMKDVFNDFISIIEKSKDEIQEKLDE